MKYSNYCQAAGFFIASYFVVKSNCSLPELCWSTWLSSLIYTWACIFIGSIQLLFSAAALKEAAIRRIPLLSAANHLFFVLAAILISVIGSYIAFWIYSYLFGFYGIFLSVFARMEPYKLFGENGFINSDFITPVVYLVINFWPIALGAIIANIDNLLNREQAWRKLFTPFHGEVVRMHIMVLIMPFLSLLFWALLGKAYQTMTVVVLMAMFYFLPSSFKLKNSSKT